MMRLIGLIAIAAASVAVVGCGGGDCAKAYDKLKECKGEDSLPSKDEFVKACEKAKDDPKMKAEVEATLECAKKDSCEAYETCEKAARGKRRAKKIQEAVEAGNWKDAFDDCTLGADYYADEGYAKVCGEVFANGVPKLVESGEASEITSRCSYDEELKKAVPAFAEACKQAASGGFDAAIAKVREARDAGKRDYALCIDLEKMAEQAGGDAVDRAKAVCNEMNLAEDAKKGMDEARANAKAKKADRPYQCKSTVEELDKLAESSEWAKKTRDELLKACYVELGQVMIEVTSKDASKYVCPFQIKEIQEMVAKYDLGTAHPEIVAALDKAPKPCKK